MQSRLMRILGIGVVAILGCAWIYITRVPVDGASAAQVTFRAPDLTLHALDRQQVSLSSLRGQAVLVNFWATWCVPCRAEMPEIQAAYQKYRARDFVVLAINIAEDENTVARFVQEFNLTFPVLLDRDGAISKRYQVRALPTTYFIDRTGMIRAIRFGQMDRAYIEMQLVSIDASLQGGGWP